MTVALLVSTLLAIILFLAAGWLWRRAGAARGEAGLPRGKVIYTDTADWRPPDGFLISRRLGVVGKPDYLVDQEDGIIPVEVKSASLPPSGSPYEGHILQLAAYCLLVEETYGRRPPYGYVHYQDATVRIPYTDTLRELLLATLAEMRAAAKAAAVPRSHDDPRRCERCGLAYVCGPEALLAAEA